MKIRFLLDTLLLLALTACHRPVETRYGTSLPLALTAIDTLMQTRPDSALTLLLEAPVDNPYYQLLLSEALYKNDSAQLNRRELLDAMAYYDSVGCPLLAARCHYMNGVGFYETDSVVPACEEYLRALEIMEDHFDEKDLVGPKAKFMALTYTRLTDLFSDQYLHVQTVEFAKKAYEYFNKYESLSWQSAWALNTIGMNYSMLELLDSAALYYQKAITVLNDTNCLIFRDISEQKALMEYEIGVAPERVLFRLKYLLSNVESNEEYYARCLAVGDVFYHEKEFDSAKIYLEKLFKGDASTTIKKQSAEWLTVICKAQGKNDEITEYTLFVAPFATQNESNSTVKSQLASLHNSHVQQRQNRSNQLKTRFQMKRLGILVGGLLVLILVLVFLYYRNKKEKSVLNDQISKDAAIKKALGSRLKHSNESLRELRIQLSQQKETLDNTNNNSDQALQFIDEPICQHILKVCNDPNKPIKSSVPVSEYASIALTNKQKAMLNDAATKHYGGLFQWLSTNYPDLGEKDIYYCYLCLLGLDNVQITAMLQLSYSTIWEREKRLQRLFNNNQSIAVILNGFLIG